ncbi:hypothetical protein V2G26_000343 [Clonostachys chloroleuca]
MLALVFSSSSSERFDNTRNPHRSHHPYTYVRGSRLARFDVQYLVVTKVPHKTPPRFPYIRSPYFQAGQWRVSKVDETLVESVEEIQGAYITPTYTTSSCGYAPPETSRKATSPQRLAHVVTAGLLPFVSSSAMWRARLRIVLAWAQYSS